MTDEDLRRIIEHGHETRGVEFKPPGRREDGYLFAQVVRAMLGMANRRGGGSIIIGLLETKDKSLEPLGVHSDAEASWHYDLVSAAAAPYADPSLSFDVEIRVYDAKRFVVITVNEFSEVPILCKKTFQAAADLTAGRVRAIEVLKVGACYVRTLKKPETAEVASHEDMRTLIDLAIEKGVQRFAVLAKSAGFSSPVGSTANALYDAELEDIL